MTEQEYSSAISLIESIDPAHKYLKLASRAYTPYNCKLAAVILSTKNIVKQDDDEELGYQVRHRHMMAEISKLSGQRAVISNRFHKCQSNQERALVSDELRIIQTSISDARQRIRYLEKFGEETIATSLDDKYPVPADRYAISKMIANHDSYISKYRKTLDKLAREKKNPNAARDIARAEAKLAHYENYREIARKALREETLD